MNTKSHTKSFATGLLVLGMVAAAPLAFAQTTPPSEPTMVTSSPSSTQAMPSATTTRQCQRDQGRRSRRAGMSVEGEAGESGAA